MSNAGSNPTCACNSTGVEDNLIDKLSALNLSCASQHSDSEANATQLPQCVVEQLSSLFSDTFAKFLKDAESKHWCQTRSMKKSKN